MHEGTQNTLDCEALPARMARPLRILLVTEASSAGVGRHVLDLAEGLAARDCQVTVIYSPLRSDAQFRTRMENLPSVRFAPLAMRRSIHPLDAWSAWQLAQAARALGPFDVIHGHSSKGGALARLAARWRGVPVVYTAHAFVTLDPLLPAARRLLYGWIERALASLGTGRVIAVCDDEAKHAAKLGIPREKIRVVPNGQAIRPLQAREEARRSLGFADDWLMIGFVGRLAPQKAPEQMLAAFAAAAQVQPRARLVMIGTGPLEEELRRQAERAGVPERILWLGNIDGETAMPALDIFCLTSLYDVTPYVVLEALQAGLPIVATRVGIVEAAVERPGCGLVVPVNRPEEFADALLHVVTDEALRLRLAAASRAQGNPYSLEAMVEGTLAVYRELGVSRIDSGLLPAGTGEELNRR